MINMNMPDFVMGFEIYQTYWALRCDHPEIFYEDTEIASIFGVFDNCIWNGGGVSWGRHYCIEEMKEIIAFYNNEMKIPVRFTFTNQLISEKECWDTYANSIALAGHNGRNEILTVSRTLEHYLREHYPRYEYCKSIIGSKDEPYSQDHRYKLTVMQRRKNNDWTYLDAIPPLERQRVEFLCNDPCPDDCPRIYTHYRDFARATLENKCEMQERNCSMKNVKTDFQWHYMLNNCETYISREMIREEYYPKGFCQFKCSGRHDKLAIVENIVEYLVLPEYHKDVRAILLSSSIK